MVLELQSTVNTLQVRLLASTLPGIISGQVIHTGVQHTWASHSHCQAAHLGKSFTQVFSTPGQVIHTGVQHTWASHSHCQAAHLGKSFTQVFSTTEVMTLQGAAK